METSNLYVYKALDAFPYDLEQTMESLNYALAYEPENVQALFLMGRVHSELLGLYPEAIAYFQAALTSNVEFQKLYPYYVDALIKNEDFTQAKTFLDFAVTVKGADKPVLTYFNGVLLEQSGAFKQAIKTFKVAKKLALNGNYVSFMESQISRVKAKLPKKKKAKKKRKRNKKKNKAKHKKKGD